MARLKTARETRDSIQDVWGPRTPYAGEGAWPQRVDERVLEQPDKWVQSCCLLCSTGCALDVGVKDGRIVGVRGRGADRVNKGRLGPKGLHGWIANNSADRLKRPLIRRHGKFREANWDEAMDLVVERTRELVKHFTSGTVGFYTSGQLFLEEYYTLALIAKAGLGTPHMDGNTRLCTATAAAALRESFGADGQPAGYDDLDLADTIMLVGHNMAETNTVLWARLLDRRKGPKPPKLIVVDPRKTETAREADVHLAPRVGANVAVLNGLLNLIIEGGGVDREFVERRTVGFEKLERIVSQYPPSRVEELSGVPAAALQEAARLLATAQALVCTALQGVYQSHQATAAAVQVNNVNLIRGMIGRPGAGVLQMNGQPTAQNNRETGADGEFPAFLNRQNPEHMRRLAQAWNVEPDAIPHWSTPTHAMELFRLAETGSLRMLWIAGTNPAVSLPELHRIRKILTAPSLFVVVNDAFMTETAQLADVVLPAALWGEKTGTFTNADRCVHLSLKAVEPPGQARSDLDIWLDFARRMDFRDKGGAPLVKWKDAEGAFEAWRRFSAGALCDYSGLSYAKLAGGSGVQWPCTQQLPKGTPRLYSDHVFPTSFEVCETFGHDLETGAATTKEDYKADDPQGRAFLKAADYLPPQEAPDAKYPFWLTTGRVKYHWHTRTKTGRSPELQAAAPEPFVELSREDAKRLAVRDGDLLDVVSRRGTVRAAARVCGILPGHVFIPFHYGYWDKNKTFMRAANELTLSEWDPISKQPLFKYAAVQVHHAGHPSLKELVGDTAARSLQKTKELVDKVAVSAHRPKQHVGDYLSLLINANEQFVEACAKVSSEHLMEHEVRAGLKMLSAFSQEAAERLKPFVARYGEASMTQPKHVRAAVFPVARTGAFGLLRDLHDLFLMFSESAAALTVLMQAAKALRDRELLQACSHIEGQLNRQEAWIMTQIKQRAAQTLTVPS